jgi:hypothetical protein
MGAHAKLAKHRLSLLPTEPEFRSPSRLAVAPAAGGHSQVDETGTVVLLGSYPAPPGPDWGWRITLSAPESGPLSLVMHNLPHAGEEDLAVRAEYVRAGG